MNKNRKRILQKLEAIVGSYASRKDAATTKKNSARDLPKYRYPIMFTGGRGEAKTKSISYEIDEEQILEGHYKFGTTNLFIMLALNEVLDYLEDNCDLEIEDLDLPEGNEKLKPGRPDIGKVEMMMDSDGTFYRVNGGKWMSPEEFNETYPNFKASKRR